MGALLPPAATSAGSVRSRRRPGSIAQRPERPV